MIAGVDGLDQVDQLLDGLAGFWTQLIYGLIIVISVSIQSVLGRRLR